MLLPILDECMLEDLRHSWLTTLVTMQIHISHSLMNMVHLWGAAFVRSRSGERALHDLPFGMANWVGGSLLGLFVSEVMRFDTLTPPLCVSATPLGLIIARYRLVLTLLF